MPATAFLCLGRLPLLLALLSLFVRPRPVQEGAPLSVSVIIAAHNEGPHIEHKLRTLLQQDYPATDLQIILASDGSSDDTVATALGVRDSRIVVLDLPRVGKAGALNAAVELARNDILVFTDAITSGPTTPWASCWRPCPTRR